MYIEISIQKLAKKIFAFLWCNAVLHQIGAAKIKVQHFFS